MGTEKIPPQANWQAKYDARKHTEDCLDANDDTSVEKGRCICPKPPKAPQHTPMSWKHKVFDRQLGSHAFEFVEDIYNGNNFLVAQAHSPKDAAFIVKAVNAHEELVTALRQLTVRFPLEFKTTKNKCKCLQFEDNEDCRHLYALQTLARAEGK